MNRDLQRDAAIAFAAASRLTPIKSIACTYAILALASIYGERCSMKQIIRAVPAKHIECLARVKEAARRAEFHFAHAEAVAAVLDTTPAFDLLEAEGEQQSQPPFIPPREPCVIWRGLGYSIRVHAPPAYDLGDPPPGRSALDQRRAAGKSIS